MPWGPPRASESRLAGVVLQAVTRVQRVDPAGDGDAASTWHRHWTGPVSALPGTRTGRGRRGRCVNGVAPLGRLGVGAAGDGAGAEPLVSAPGPGCPWLLMPCSTSRRSGSLPRQPKQRATAPRSGATTSWVTIRGNEPLPRDTEQEPPGSRPEGTRHCPETRSKDPLHRDTEHGIAPRRLLGPVLTGVSDAPNGGRNQRIRVELPT